MFEKARVAVLAILTCCIFVSVRPAVSQIDDIQAAIARKDHLGALRIPSAISDEASTPDTYLYRGVAYANLRQYKRALEAFREGFNRYPTDPRFHNEGVAFYRRTQGIVDAKAQLRNALIADPGDGYASELLASLELSDGNMGPALAILNQSGEYKSSGVRLNLKHIPDHRLELGAGLEYLNRAADNTGRVLLNAVLDGRNLSEGKGVLTAYIERRFW